MPRGIPRDVALGKSFALPRWETAKLKLKQGVFNVFNRPLSVLNNGKDVWRFLTLPSLAVNANDPHGPKKPNPNYGSCTSCISPVTGRYLGTNGAPLNVSNFQTSNQNAATNYAGLAAASSDVTPRLMQLAIRFRW